MLWCAGANQAKISTIPAGPHPMATELEPLTICSGLKKRAQKPCTNSFGSTSCPSHPMATELEPLT